MRSGAKKKKTVEPNRSQTATQYDIEKMRCSYWVTQATYTHTDYVILVDITRQQWLSERPSVIPYTRSACLFQ